jgi:hypothetical protein
MYYEFTEESKKTGKPRLLTSIATGKKKKDLPLISNEKSSCQIFLA